MKTTALLRNAGLAIVAACAANASLYFAGLLAGADFIVPHGPTQELGPLGVGGVLGVTAGAMALGTVVFLGLNKLAPQKGWAIWCTLAALLFVVSFLPFAGGFAVSTKVWLGLMHVTTPAALFVALARTRKDN